MAGVTVEITADTATPTLASAAQALDGDGLQLLLSDIGEYLVRSTRERADRQVSPDGNAWAALSPRYRRFKDRKRPGRKILRFDNHLLGDQFTYQVAGNELQVGTNAKYGAIHQFGGEINIAARSQEATFSLNRKTGESRFARRSRANFAQRVTIPAYKITMPARPWLGLSADDEQEIAAITADHLAGLFAARP